MTITDLTLARPGRRPTTKEVWVLDGLCRDQPGPWDQNSHPSDKLYALSVCQQCPVRLTCLEAGIDETEGVWGGMTASERVYLASQRRKTKPRESRAVITIDAVREYAAQGLTIEDAAKALRVKPSSIASNLSKLGGGDVLDALYENAGQTRRHVKKRRTREETLAALEECAAQGMTVSEAAQELEYSTTSNLRGWLRRTSPNTLNKFKQEETTP